MTLEEAKEILKYNIDSKGGLDSSDKGIDEYMCYIPWHDDYRVLEDQTEKITLDGAFTAIQLEAIAIYMKSFIKEG